MTLAATNPSEEWKRAKPFLKWAGGKQQLLAQYEPYFPSQFDGYIEPFVGGGAVFFHLWSNRRIRGSVTLSDSNPELVNAYRVVRDDVEQLIESLAIHKERHSRDYYYAIRRLDRQDGPLSDAKRAARTIYLNKTCFNGLYRVNAKGQFNVPMGRYDNPAILEEEALRAASAALQGVTIKHDHYRWVMDFAKAGDLIYFDPPYQPLSETASFTNYTACSFREADQRELADIFGQLTDRGCICRLSNSYTPLVLSLYSQFDIRPIHASRAINSNVNGRGSIPEVLVLGRPRAHQMVPVCPLAEDGDQATVVSMGGAV